MQTEVNESVLFTILPFKMHPDWPTAVFCSVSYRYFLTDTENKFSHVIHIEILGEKLVELSQTAVKTQTERTVLLAKLPLVFLEGSKGRDHVSRNIKQPFHNSRKI